MPAFSVGLSCVMAYTHFRMQLLRGYEMCFYDVREIKI
ncbi:hypothetical protein AOR13_1528 [Alteromonas stellipolaris LMG 21856]|nr:hypothetical protein AOR13_1528 [Alteromonas stellipolaris LMG 21856]